MDFVQLFSPVETLDDFLNKTFAISVLYFEFLENYILVTFFFVSFSFIYIYLQFNGGLGYFPG